MALYYCPPERDSDLEIEVLELEEMDEIEEALDENPEAGVDIVIVEDND